MHKKAFERCIVMTFFLDIGFAILLSGCYSALHQGQVMDGYSMAFALRPSHREYAAGGLAMTEAHDIKASMAFRRGRAPSKEGEKGYSVGILVDWSASPEVAETNTDIDHSFPLLVRCSYYYQFSKNPFLDVGIGGEYGVWPPIAPLIPYAVISRELGTRFMLYSEVRIWPSALYSEESAGLTVIVRDNYLIVPTLGGKFDATKDLSLLAEISLFPELLDCEHGHGRTQCEYRSSLAVAPVIGVGIVHHGWDGWPKRKPVLDNDGNVITEEEIRTNIQADRKLMGCFGCLGSSGILLLAYAMDRLFEGNLPESVFSIGMPVGVLAGWVVGDLVEVHRDRKQAIELIKARRRQFS
jgi:hypothetical protein